MGKTMQEVLEGRPIQGAIPSMVGFDHDEFRNMLRDELTYHGFDRKDLAVLLHSNKNHIDCLMDKGLEFKFEEFNILNKRFNFY